MIAILRELKQMWFSYYLKLFFFIIIIVFSQKVLAKSNNCKNNSFDTLNFKKLDKIEIVTIENRKLQLNNLQILTDARKSILPKYKKNIYLIF